MTTRAAAQGTALVLLLWSACGERAAKPHDGGPGGFAHHDSDAAITKLTCSAGEVVDLTRWPSCLALARKLYPCCRSKTIVDRRYLAVMMHMCDANERYSDADCKALAIAPWIEQECERLEMTWPCQIGKRWSCGKYTGKSTAEGCTAEWGCSTGKYQIECSGTVGDYTCKCIVDGSTKGTFSAPDACDILGSMSEHRNRQVYRANAGCGWKLPLSP